MVLIIKVSISTMIVNDISWYPDRNIANKEFLKLGASDNDLFRGDFIDHDNSLVISICDLN